MFFLADYLCGGGCEIDAEVAEVMSFCIYLHNSMYHIPYLLIIECTYGMYVRRDIYI